MSYNQLLGKVNIKKCRKKAHIDMPKTNSEFIEAKENYVSEDRTHKNIPNKQRALVLQGGGALGAYEVGVLKILCKNLPKNKGSSEEGDPLFDIIAGTSMGAMNAAVLVSNVVNRNKTWEEAVAQLEIFWTDEEKGLSSTPDFSKWWWNERNDQNKKKLIKTEVEEAARKYYSVKEYLKHGTPNVCTPPLVRGDVKFGDQTDNLWFYHLCKPLEDTIIRHSIEKNNEKLTVASSWDKNQPRLLVVCVDVADGKTVTFDSYHKEPENSKNSLYEGDGISIDHIMASGTLPEFYDFRTIGERKFCDGGLLSNTPFRELLQAHHDYWLGIIDTDKQKIPDLEVYIVNVHPSKKDGIKDDDHDGIKDRINDIMFFDRNSSYDENAKYVEADYTDIIDRLKEIALKYVSLTKIDAFQNDFQNFLKTNQARSKTNANKDRTYRDLLIGRFKLTNVVRIENTEYENSIYLKGADFTSKSIRNLIDKGEKDALKWFNSTRNDSKN